MQSTGHSSMQALSSTSTHGSAMMYVTGLSLHSHAAISYGGYEPSISPSRRSQVLRRQDVGHRVVVRRIVGSSRDRPLYTDALGELVELTETHLTLATAQGTLRVPLRDVHRAKRVPAARRPPSADVVALELAADEAWPSPVRGGGGAPPGCWGGTRAARGAGARAAPISPPRGCPSPEHPPMTGSRW